MTRLFTLLITLNLTLSTYAQQEKTFFSDAITLHLKKYNENCKNAALDRDFERVDYLFDSLVKNHLKGTFLEDLTIKKLSGGTFKTKDTKNPFLLTTTTTWYIKNDEEIEAINKLALEFNGKVDIVVLFWDTKRNVKKVAKKYNKDVIITYVDETMNRDNSIINSYKHSLGFPTAFYITTEKKIISIDRGSTVRFNTIENSSLYADNYTFYHKKMIQLLLSDNLSKDTILTDTD